MNSVAAGVEKVRNSNGNYAFIMESSSADFWESKPPCDLVTVGSQLNTNHYGLATKRGDGLRNDINRVLQVSFKGPMKQWQSRISTNSIFLGFAMM